MTVSVSVLVATYKRMDRLTSCLEGLRAQSRPPGEVVVVVHDSDSASARTVDQVAVVWRPLRCVRVGEHGTVAALNRGLAAVSGDVVAIVDDDAVPHPDWLERIASTYESDSRIAAVGGRDLIMTDRGILGPPHRRETKRSGGPDVGRIQWFGRMLGNHHFGVGGPRDVDVLKGANMSVRRRDVIAHGYDERLRGEGAVVHTEMSICLPLRKRGLRVIYDPNIVVTHFPAPRGYGYDRVELRHEEVAASVHNETLEVLDYFGAPRRVVFLVWGVMIGTSGAPGLAILVRDLLTRRPAAVTRFRAAQVGRVAACRTRRIPRTTPAALLPSPGPTVAATVVY